MLKGINLSVKERTPYLAANDRTVTLEKPSSEHRSAAMPPGFPCAVKDLSNGFPDTGRQPISIR